MTKRVFLYVTGSDYSALDFSRAYGEQEFYENMMEEGLTQTSLNTDDIYADIKILEFGDIDDKFIDFIRHEIMDYDSTKDSDFFEVRPIEIQ